MSSRFKKIMIILLFLLGFTYLAGIYKVDVGCEQCGITAHSESLLSRIVTGFEDNFLHLECVQAYLDDNPIERDDNGGIIKKTVFLQGESELPYSDDFSLDSPSGIKGDIK